MVGNRDKKGTRPFYEAVIRKKPDTDSLNRKSLNLDRDSNTACSDSKPHLYRLHHHPVHAAQNNSQFKGTERISSVTDPQLVVVTELSEEEEDLHLSRE